MEELTKQTNLKPNRILVFSSDPSREGVVGELRWNGEIWEIHGSDLDVLRMLSDTGMVYDGKIYTREDHEFYLPLINGRYTSIKFEAS